MCLFIDEDDDDTGSESKNTGSPKLQLRNHHTWLIPRRILLIVLVVAIMMAFLGVIMMAIGGGIGSVGLRAAGGVLFGLGLIGLIICLVVCLYAFFFYGTKDQETQTTEMAWSEEYSVDSPAYASIARPSALKSSDSTLKRNGILGPKKVTMAPELGDYGEIPTSAASMHAKNMSQGEQGANLGQGQGVGVNTSAGAMNVAYGTSHGSVATSPGSVSVAQNVHPSSRTMSLSSNSSANNSSVFVVEGGNLQRGAAGMESGTLPRGTGGIDGSTVGTGGIRITPLDGSQPFPSPGSSVSYGGSTGQYHSLTGGGSSASGSIETYAYPKSIIHGNQSSFDTVSQSSTLRSIPVTHIVNDGQRQIHYHEDGAEYARVNKPVRSVHQNVRVDLPQQGIISSQGQVQFQRRFREDDFDYDNPVERTPMIPPQQQNVSYHEQQMQYQQRQRMHQQQQQQDMHAPRQINTYSLQRQMAANPFQFNQQQQHQHHQQQQQQQQQYQTVTLYEQQQQQQQQQKQQQQYNVSNSTSARNSYIDDLPAPQPLVYPSARRPMTFEQVSSSKISVYDNVLANNLRGEEEEEE